MISCVLLRVSFSKIAHFAHARAWTSPIFPTIRTQLSVHSSAISFVKQQKDSENAIAHKVMEDNDAYSETVIRSATFCIQPQLQYPIDRNKIFSKFYDVTVNNLTARHDIEHQQFANMCSDLAKNFQKASFEELIVTLYCMCFWPCAETIRGRNYKILWNTLDFECCRRLSKLSTVQKLLIADYWYHLQLSRVSNYNLSLIRDLIPKMSSLTENQTVQLFFLSNLQRNVPQSLMTRMDNHVERIIGSVSISEISLICLGYFKNGSVVRNNNIIKLIMNRVIPEMEKIEAPLVVSIIKCVRKSFQINMSPMYQTFINKCGDICQQWDVSASVHAALLSSVAYIFEPRILDNAVEKLEKNITCVRLKDITKLLQCHSLFNYPPCSEFNNLLILEYLKKDREEEFFIFPHDSIYVPVYYSYMGLYDHNVLEKVLKKDVVKRYRDTEHRALLHLDCSIDIECPEYSGPRLDPSLRNYVVTQKRDEAQAQIADHGTIVSKVIQNVLKTLESFEDSKDNVCSWHVLPHMYNADVILRLNPKPNSMPLSDIFRKNPCGIISVPSGETWIAFVICGTYSFPFNSDRPCGLLATRLRQLTLLGYKTVTINCPNVPHDEHQRHLFLKERLNSEIKKDKKGFRL